MVTPVSVRWRIGRVTSVTLLLGMGLFGPWAPAAANDVAEWNTTALNVLIAGGQNTVVLTRGLTMVAVAVHDALNGVDRRYEGYAFEGSAEPNASAEAAVATAARDALVLAVPDSARQRSRPRRSRWPTRRTARHWRDPGRLCQSAGVAVGRAAAAAIVGLRKDDGALKEVPYTPGGAPGQWRPHPNPVPADPPIPSPALALGYAASMLPGWGNMTPFTLLSGAQFRPAGPPVLTSEAYARDFNEVKRLGGKQSTARTPEQSQIARYWYEGSPQGWNRIARVVAAAKNADRWELARLLALVNMAMADGFIAGWNTRYHYNLWRPVTAIRLADTDANPATEADPGWETFLNTPPIPDYPRRTASWAGRRRRSGRVLRHDQVAFTRRAARRSPGWRGRSPASSRPRRRTPIRGCTPGSTSGRLPGRGSARPEDRPPGRPDVPVAGPWLSPRAPHRGRLGRDAEVLSSPASRSGVPEVMSG